MNVHTPLPSCIITGYLGSGKTTLLNHLLRKAKGRRIAVLVNDFGDMAIDADLILSKEDDTYVLSNGCICCSIGGQFFKAIDSILKRRANLDILLIETSGVADAQVLADIAKAEADLLLDGVVTVVDSLELQACLKNTLLKDTLERQLRAATIVLLNKTDRGIDVQKNYATIQRLNPHAHIFKTSHGRIDSDIILDASLNSHQPMHALAAVSLPKDARLDHQNIFFRWSWQGSCFLPRKALEKFLDRAAPLAYRMKGFVYLCDGSLLAVHSVAGQYTLSKASMSLKKSFMAKQVSETSLVAIGLKSKEPNFEAGRIEQLWQEALAEKQRAF